MTLFTALLVVLFIGISSFLEMTIGFGFAIVAMPLMSLVMGPKAAVLYVTVAALLIRPLLMWNTRHDCQVEVLAVMVPGLLLGTIPGGYVLKIVSNAHLKIFLGIMLLAALALMVKKVRLPISNLHLGRFLAGIGCGFLGACTSMSGPPVALWFANEQMEKKPMRGNMIWMFSLANLTALLASFWTGTFKELGVWQNLLYTVPGLVLGYILGVHFLTRINQNLFTRLVQILILLGAVTLLAGGFMGGHN